MSKTGNLCSVAIMGWILATVPGAAAADAERGKEVLFNNCRPCHTVEKGAKPDMYGFNLNLYGVIGRPAASIEGFYYSDAMVDSGIVWDAEKIDTFITDPQAFVDGTRMAFPGLPDARDREDIVEYLKQSVDEE